MSVIGPYSSALISVFWYLLATCATAKVLYKITFYIAFRCIHTGLQCFDTVGRASGRASGL